MKAAPFEYSRPSSVAEACALLAHDEDARIIAGGQTLVPMMAMRLARPTRLVDIVRIPDLSFIRDEGDAIVVGGGTRQAMLERHAAIAARLPLLARALPWVGHAATRNCGTVGGSIANADPAAEIPLVLVTLGGSIRARSTRDDISIDADDLFEGPMTTALAPDACLTDVRFPTWSHARTGSAFQEISARHGDFAYVSAAAQVALDADGVCIACAIGVGGATAVPTRLKSASGALVGGRLDDAAARDAIAAEIETFEIMIDPHASPAYRRRVAMTLAHRVVVAARDEALSRKPA